MSESMTLEEVTNAENLILGNIIETITDLADMLVEDPDLRADIDEKLFRAKALVDQASC